MRDPFQIYPPDSPKRKAAEAYLSADTVEDVNAAARRIYELGEEDARAGREFDWGLRWQYTEGVQAIYRRGYEGEMRL